ncbi:hypothetical protein Alches_25880 [Alicyclobacillus hesperidum subsp. aegles]|uniref:hypothetical protein n=1 Tax=Alicyclobacillus TaxID=29330 RepID=UPI001193D21E|nr:MULTISPECIES: hypothetical protein [Alicyclobacillus]GEO27486.1 hypothetical protein AAC03nite_32710 [Alicyclobacillus acidoterrestris]GLG02547.1 hypothetical protein Alches_25880 [Alicyclobacillus hesperidum subsp. aegles]
MAKRRMTKADKWIVALGDLSKRYGVALMEIYDGARLLDGKSGKELGHSLAYICGLYTSHRAASYKRKQKAVSPVPKDLQGFVTEFNALSEEVGVRLELRSAPVLLADTETMEPLGRLQETAEGYTFTELQLV